MTFVEADGLDAERAVEGRRFAGVLCHGVIGYLDEPAPLVEQLCRCVADGGVVSIMTGNAQAGAVRPAMERRWDDALAAFDARHEIGVLGVPGRADTVAELGDLLRRDGVEPLTWYGVWLFVDWLEFAGVELDATTRTGCRRRPRSSSRPVGETPTGASAASSTSSGGRRADARGGGQAAPPWAAAVEVIHWSASGVSTR